MAAHSIYLSPDLMLKVRRLARASGLSFTAYVRMILIKKVKEGECDDEAAA